MIYSTLYVPSRNEYVVQAYYEPKGIWKLFYSEGWRTMRYVSDNCSPRPMATFFGNGVAVGFKTEIEAFEASERLPKEDKLWGF